MANITGKVKFPSWKKRKRSKSNISKPLVKSADGKMKDAKARFKSKAAWLGLTEQELKERDKAKAKANEARKEIREAKLIARDHLEGNGDLLAPLYESDPKARPITEQLKALERQKFRLTMKRERLLKSSNGAHRKSEFGPFKTKLIGEALRFATNVPFEGMANKVAVSAIEAPLNADDREKLSKLDRLIQQCDFNIWTLEQRLPKSLGGEGNGQFNRNAVKRERHYHADKGHTVISKVKPNQSNNWRKEMNARQIARAIYEDELNPNTQNTFNLALAAYDRLSDNEKAMVALYQQEIIKRKAGVK